MKRIAQIAAALLLGLSPLVAPRASAGPGTSVTVSTSGLAPGTYYLDFQLTAGNSFAGASTAAVSAFSFTGGSLGTSLPPVGGAEGDLAGGLMLTDDAAGGIADYTQAFTLNGPGQIGFTVGLAATSADPAAPDTFVFSLLDSALAPLPTTGPIAGALVTENITTTDPVLLQSGLQQYALVPVPESSTAVSLGLFGLGLGVVIARRTRRA